MEGVTSIRCGCDQNRADFYRVEKRSPRTNPILGNRRTFMLSFRTGIGSATQFGDWFALVDDESGATAIVEVRHVLGNPHVLEDRRR